MHSIINSNFSWLFIFNQLAGVPASEMLPSARDTPDFEYDDQRMALEGLKSRRRQAKKPLVTQARELYSRPTANELKEAVGVNGTQVGIKNGFFKKNHKVPLKLYVLC